ncbi:MAG TPA: hypothetical protein VGE09_08320 [Pseudoxanthomonas sp.]
MTRPMSEERERILADAEWVIAHYDDSTRAVRIARALLSTSSAERGMREALEWQVIDAAPTDDPAFIALGCNPSRSGDGWDYYLITRHDIGGRYECWVVPPGRPVNPTHFRILPTPPRRLSPKGEG